LGPVPHGQPLRPNHRPNTERAGSRVRHGYSELHLCLQARPCGVIGKLCFIADYRAMRRARVDLPIWANHELDYQAELICSLQQRSHTGRKLLRQHREIPYARIDRRRFLRGMLIYSGVLRNKGIHICDAHHHTRFACGQPSATSIWSRYREVSLSIEDHRRLRRSRIVPPGATCGGCATNCESCCSASGGYSGSKPFQHGLFDCRLKVEVGHLNSDHF
jgi:hypothetical protein